jgi:TPR repeat protein
MPQENDELQEWPPEGWDGILEGEETIHKEVVEIAQKAAKEGSATAQYVLGTAHYFGKGLPTNRKEAFEWYFKAATQGLPHAQYNLGVMHENGEACPPNPEKAFLWYEKAATQGFAKAQHNLAALWEAGLGTPQNLEKAAHWFEEAAKQNDVRAQYRLALLLLRREASLSSPPSSPSSPPSSLSPEGTQLQTGLHWLHKAVGQNFAPAKYTLGFLLEHGVGLPQNLEEARRLYAEAALGEVPEARLAAERLK